MVALVSGPKSASLLMTDKVSGGSGPANQGDWRLPKNSHETISAERAPTLTKKYIPLNYPALGPAARAAIRYIFESNSNGLSLKEEGEIRRMFSDFEKNATLGIRTPLTDFMARLQEHGFSVGVNGRSHGASFSTQDRHIELNKDLWAAAQKNPGSIDESEATFQLCKAYFRICGEILRPLDVPSTPAGKRTRQSRERVDTDFSNFQAAAALPNSDLAALIDKHGKNSWQLNGLHIPRTAAQQARYSEIKAMKKEMDLRHQLYGAM